jgi:eukaryotic-like serine/threonine-protein kinase
VLVEVGSILAGKYRIDRVLGRGGMGIVVQAMHLQLGQSVAVKFLLPEVLDKDELVQRFLREAQAAVRLRSEHVARVIDVGTLDTGAPYMVLEYLDGTDLAHYPRSHLTPGVIVDLMLQACEALAEAHSLGIIHRDLKPANFFVTKRSDGSALLKILDFGISKAPTAQDSNLTTTQVVMGTPAYMSPEQMKSARGVDARSDIWSLGVVLYQLLEGEQPFEAESFAALCIKVATEPPRPMATELPAGFAEIVYRCLEKTRAQRFANVGQLARALAPFARSATQAAITLERTAKVASGGADVLGATMPDMAIANSTTLTSSAVALTPKPVTKPRRFWPFAAASVLVLAAIAAFALVSSSGGGSSTTPPTTNAIAPTAMPEAMTNAMTNAMPDAMPPVTSNTSDAGMASGTASTTTPATEPVASVSPPPPAPRRTKKKTAKETAKPAIEPATTEPLKPPPPPPPTASDDILEPRN